MKCCNEKVSVIIPVYNAENYIAETLESILNQTYTNLEIVIVDDCGTDGSMDIVRQYADDRIVILKNDQNSGIAYSRNRALEYCSGEFIALLDHDDIASTTRIEKQVAFLTAHPDIDIVGGNAQWVDEKGAVIRGEIDVVEDPQHIKMLLLFRNIFNNSEMTFRRKIVDEYQIRYSDKCFGMEDFLFWIKCSKVTKISNISDLVLKKREIQSNETSNMRKNHEKQRKEKFLEMQKFSLSLSGFEIKDTDEKILEKFFSEHPGTCEDIEEVEELSTFLTNFMKQARELNVDFCAPLEKWFAELLEWNIESVKESYLASWKKKSGLQCEKENSFTEDLLVLKEMKKTYAQKERHIKELIEGTAWLEEQKAAQEKHIAELLEGKEWLEQQLTEYEQQRAEQEQYIQELLEGNKWLEQQLTEYEQQRAEQEQYIQELLAGKKWLEQQREEHESYIRQLQEGNAWLEAQNE